MSWTEEDRQGCRSCLLAIGGIILTGLGYFAFMYAYEYFTSRPGNRVVNGARLAKIQSIALVSFTASPEVGYRRLGDPEGAEQRYNGRAARAICQMQLALWRNVSWRWSIDPDRAIQSPAFARNAGRLAKGASNLAITCDDRLAAIPPADAAGYGYLAPLLRVDAVLFVHNSYFFQIEGVDQKPWWVAVVETEARLVDAEGNVLWRASKIRGESARVRAESGINLFVLETSTLSSESVAPMLLDASLRNAETFGHTFLADLAKAK